MGPPRDQRTGFFIHQKRKARTNMYVFAQHGILSIVAHRAVDCVEELAIFIRGAALPMHNFPCIIIAV
jgi:hypothetical protein